MSTDEERELQKLIRELQVIRDGLREAVECAREVARSTREHNERIRIRLDRTRTRYVDGSLDGAQSFNRPARNVPDGSSDNHSPS